MTTTYPDKWRPRSASTDTATATATGSDHEKQTGAGDRTNSTSPVVDDGLQKLADDRSSVTLGNPNGLTWIQTSALLGTEYISLAILSFPWSFSYLGIVGGILVTLVTQAIVVYTSMILWRFCMQNPGIKHICDIGQILFGGHRIFYELTMLGLVINNILIAALHCLTGSIMLNTVTDHGLCTVAFAGFVALVSAIFTLPRQFSQLSWLGWVSAICMFSSIVVAMVFSAVQNHPVGYDGTPVHFKAGATTSDFISVFSATENIIYTLVGTIVIPSFVADMKEPRDFPKALYIVSIVEVLLMVICGTLMYSYLGQYTVAPVFGSLQNAKIPYYLAIPAILMIGVLYASVLDQFLYMRITKGTRHAIDSVSRGNTAGGWAIWTGLVFATWALGFVVAQVIPFFSDLLSLMASLLDSAFGFYFWGVAYFHINPQARVWLARIPLLPISWRVKLARSAAAIEPIDVGARKELGQPLEHHSHDHHNHHESSSDSKQKLQALLANTPHQPTRWTTAECLLNIVIIAIGILILTVGSWVSVASIIRSYRAGTVGRPFSCANNGFVV
ncbi:hypothetical protein PYCC9005_002035 [Savitreella phatthalungensis]